MKEQANDYLEEVVQQQANVEGELKKRKRAPVAPSMPLPLGSPASMDADEDMATDKRSRNERPSLAGQSTMADYRITGLWPWKTVVVQPNVYVVHTRRGHPEPLDMGLGISFRYNPYTDAFLIIPATVQTLLINARCICAERQGVLVQAYVQWIIDDIGTAYRKLDFSDSQDPMGIVNVQLREQAEAAIKDKVCTLSIDEILSDKQPIIEELTHRLRAVAEGSRETGSGLGLKIVTVQIKEAVVSSTRLWENLQKPFRAEREKLARLAELAAEEEVASRELTNRQTRETAELDHTRQMARLKAEQEREVYDRKQAEQARRHQLEQEAEQRAVAERTATERVRQEAELELTLQQLELKHRRISQELESIRREMELEQAKAERERQQTAAMVERDNLIHQGEAQRTERDLALFKLRRASENELTPEHITSQLIARLPEIAGSLPQPEELRTVSIGNEMGSSAAGLVSFLASMLQLAEGTLHRRPSANGTTGNGEEDASSR